MTSAIVIGTVIGSGIFLLPVSLAPLGINAPIAWVISGIGALCIAFALSRIVRPEGQGLQSYIEEELGATAGFVVTFSLWVSCWTAMASTAVAAAAALSWIVPSLGDAWSVAMVAIATTIAVTAVNLRGVRAAGGFAVVTVAIRILPLLAAVVAVLSMKARHQPLAPLAPTPITTDNLATAVTSYSRERCFSANRECGRDNFLRPRYLSRACPFIARGISCVHRRYLPCGAWHTRRRGGRNSDHSRMGRTVEERRALSRRRERLAVFISSQQAGAYESGGWGYGEVRAGFPRQGPTDRAA